MSDVKILVVEDDAIEALDIKKTLESFGYSVPYVASKGEEAVTKSLELMPDLVLMDIILKGETNGIKAAKKIKDLNIPVIYLTAHSEEATVKKAKLTEPYGYLIKPYDIFELKFVIELALFKSKQERKLKESEENFRAIAENANEGILLVVDEGVHVYANQMAAEITGYSVEEMLGKTISDLAHQNEITMLMERYEARVSGKNLNSTYETQIVQKDGNIVPVEITAAKTVWKGQPADMVILHDISKRKKAEKELHKANLYNRSLIEASLDPLVTIGPDGKITDVNSATEDVTGCSRDILIGTDFSDYFTEPDKAREGYRQVFRDGFVRDYSLEIQHKDGGITSVLYNASVYKDESGDVVGVFAAARDITEKQRIENIMQARYRLLEFASSNSMDDLLAAALDEIEALTGSTMGFYIFIGKDQRTLSLQNWATNTLKMCKAEGKGLHYDISEAGVWVDCVYERRPVIHNDYASLPHRKGLPEGHVPLIRELLIPIKRGNLIKAVIGIANKPENYDEKDIEIASQLGDLSWDIVESKRAEDEIKKSLNEKEVLLGEIHHRVKNNMQIISSLLNLQTQYVTDSETVEVLHESQDRVKAMAAIYEKLYLSKDLTKINFNDYIQSIVQGLFYSHKVKEGQIIPIIEIGDIMLNIETAVPCGLIISELVYNSLKHAFPNERKGEIKVSLQNSDGAYELMISDNGVGFPEGIDFRNTDTLGLKLVNNLVNQIEGESTLDRSQGTEFKITFNELEYTERI